ncbi:MAG: ribonuclease P protein component [Rickettsiales bacterium]|nr:ribonuclease P protein component [Rickettsiales bacterium]
MKFYSPKTSVFVRSRSVKNKIVSKSTIFIFEKNSFFDIPESKIHFGITISKKSVKNAVNRNKCKRRIKAIIHNYLQTSDFPGITVIIIVRSKILKFSFATLQRELINNLNLIKKHNINGR